MDTVIFVPGSFGSQLFAQTALGRVKIWINPIALAAQGFRRLNLDDPSEVGRISVGDVVMPIYQKILNKLSQSGKNVIEFPYDWRHDVNSPASDLSTTFIGEAGSASKIHIITHSLGGMVVRRAVQILHDVPGMDAKIGKIIMIAPANQGCFVAAFGIAATTSDIPVFNMFPNPSPAVQIVTSSFPSLYQTLPFDSSVFPSLLTNNVGDPSWWKVPVHPEYVALSTFQKNLDVPSVHDKMTIIVGGSNSDETASGVEWVDGELATSGSPIDGDGFVPYVSSTLPGVKRFISPHSDHLDLPKDQSVIQACLDLIEGKPVTTLSEFP